MENQAHEMVPVFWVLAALVAVACCRPLGQHVVQDLLEAPSLVFSGEYEDRMEQQEDQAGRNPTGLDGLLPIAGNRV